jgi:hypothetical protein
MSTVKIACALLAAMAIAAPSQAALVDFSTQATDLFSDPQTHQGFVWDFSAGGWFVGPHDTAFCPSCTSNGTSNLVAAGDRGATARVVMNPDGGGSFDLFTLDAATANTTEANILDIVGTFSGGGTASASLSIDGSFNGYSLSGFVGLSSVEFSSRNSGAYNFGGFSIDNLSTTAPAGVPEPSALLLLAGGLAALYASRRKRVSVA